MHTRFKNMLRLYFVVVHMVHRQSKSAKNADSGMLSH